MRRGVSIVAAALLLGSLLFHAWKVDQFKSSAMRFVAAEAVSFVVVPDLVGFFNYGTKSFNEIINAIGGDEKPSNFVSLLLPAPKLQGESLPSSCRAISSSDDLDKNGIVPQSSFSFASLDSGFKLAAKLKPDGSGVLFLSDLLFPTYIRIAYPSQSQEQPDGDAKSAENEKSDKRDVYKFSFDIKGSDSEHCANAAWKATVDGGLPYSAAVPGDHLFVPVRFSNAMLNPQSAPPKIDVVCNVSKNSEAAQPCGCEFIELGIDSTENSPLRRVKCEQADEFKKRKDDLSRWLESLRNGDTVSIGDQYVAMIDGFHVIEGFLSGRRRPASFRVTKPTVSIVNDDSLITQFERVLGEGKQYPTTIFAGVRPDLIVHSAGINGLPIYLMTPIGIHLSDRKLYVNALSNLEPQDMAIVQTIATASKSRNDQRSWKDWRKGFGGRLSDNSLKLYAEFLRAYFPNADAQLAEVAPLAQVAIDVMAEGAGAVVVSVGELYSDKDRNKDAARLAIAVPDVDAENAGWIVTQSRRRSVLRQARYTIEKASNLALEQGGDAKDIKQAAMNLTCESPLWRLSTIDVRPPRDGETTPQIRSNIDINEESFNRINWSVAESGFQFQRILPFEDANVALWGNAYVGGTGLAEAEALDIKPQADDFFDYIEEMLSNLNDAQSNYTDVLSAMVPVLSGKSAFLESKRTRLSKKRISAQVNELGEVTSASDAVSRLKAIKEAFRDADDLASLGQDEVATLCQTADRKLSTSPIAMHDRKASILYVVDAPELIGKFVASSVGGDSDGKLLVGFEMPHLAELLTANQTITADQAKQMASFPFGKMELALTGRQTGTGISASVVVEKDGGK